MRFSIITVCLNPGETLTYTLDSIKNQKFTDYEVIIKDGGSTDGSLNGIPSDERFRLITQKDAGIYDAMNQAVTHAMGDYLIFMNCGDRFHDDMVLADVSEKLPSDTEKVIAYGDSFSLLSEAVAKAAPSINHKVCYNGIPCHQAMFYSRNIFSEKTFDTRYKIRGDYDHFLYFFYRGGAEILYLNRVICDYEGGGFSENKKNRKRDKAEHSEIVKKYIPLSKRFLFKLRLIITLQPIRAKLAKSKTFGAVYEKIREKVR